jgi:hypothetical protein
LANEINLLHSFRRPLWQRGRGDFEIDTNSCGSGSQVNYSAKHFKKTLRAALNPDAVGEDNYDLVMARRAIREFSQTTSDAEAVANLMIYAVECGNRFTLDCGDIDEDFYDGLVEIYAAATKKVLLLPKDVQSIYRKRLKKIMKSSDGIGWGYHDDLCAHFDKAFPEK